MNKKSGIGMLSAGGLVVLVVLPVPREAAFAPDAMTPLHLERCELETSFYQVLKRSPIRYKFHQPMDQETNLLHLKGQPAERLSRRQQQLRGRGPFPGHRGGDVLHPKGRIRTGTSVVSQ